MISSSDCTSIFSLACDIILPFSSDKNVLFEFSDKMTVGMGGTRRFDCSDSNDMNLMRNVIDVTCIDDEFNIDGGFSIWCGFDKFDTPDYVVRIGIKDFSSLFGRFKLDYDCALASFVVSLEHEMRHVQQYDVARNVIERPDDMRIEVIRSLVMSCDNYNFYNENYPIMPHEIDAESHGIVDAYNFLVKHFDASYVKNSMLSVFERSDRLNISPVKYEGYFSDFSVSSFLSFINTKFNDALIEKRNTDTFSNLNSKDFAVDYLRFNSDDNSVFSDIDIGYLQDEYLAAMSIYFCDKSKSFFSEEALSFSGDVSLPCGGRLYKPVVVDDLSSRLLFVDVGDCDIVIDDSPSLGV